MLHFQPNQTSGNCPAEAAPCKTPSAPRSLLLPTLTSASPTAGSGPGKNPSPTEPPSTWARGSGAPSLDSRASPTVTHALQLPRDPATQPSVSPLVSLSSASAACGRLSEDAKWKIRELDSSSVFTVAGWNLLSCSVPPAREPPLCPARLLLVAQEPRLLPALLARHHRACVQLTFVLFNNCPRTARVVLLAVQIFLLCLTYKSNFTTGMYMQEKT